MRYMPVKVRPKTNCFGSTSEAGVVVLVIVSLDGSMPCKFAEGAGAATPAYVLEDSHIAVTSFAGDCLNALRGRNWRSIVSNPRNQTGCGARGFQSGGSTLVCKIGYLRDIRDISILSLGRRSERCGGEVVAGLSQDAADM